MAGAGDGRGAARTASRRGRRPDPAQPSRHEAVHVGDARARPRRGRGDGDDLGPRRARRGHRDRRVGAVVGVHGEPHRRDAAARPDRRRAGRRPRAARGRARRRRRGRRRAADRRRAAAAVDRVHRRRAEPVDGGRGRAQGARDRLRRRVGDERRAVPARPVGGRRAVRHADLPGRRRPGRGAAAGRGALGGVVPGAGAGDPRRRGRTSSCPSSRSPRSCRRSRWRPPSGSARTPTASAATSRPGRMPWTGSRSRRQSGYSSLRHVRGSTGPGLGVRSCRNEKYGATNGSGADTV